jgi:hypothetical protein
VAGRQDREATVSPWLLLIPVPAVVACLHEWWRDRHMTDAEREERSRRSDEIWRSW